MKIPISKRPMHKYKAGRWVTSMVPMSLTGRSVEIAERFLFACDDLSKVVGCCAFGYDNKDGIILVFDFSASHLCPNQLKRVLKFYEDAH